MLTLDRFKLYAHIDHADEDELIESLIRAADTAVRDMTGKEPPSDSDELFDTAVLQLTAHWYENRTPVTDTSVTQVPFTVQTDHGDVFCLRGSAVRCAVLAAALQAPRPSGGHAEAGG